MHELILLMWSRILPGTYWKNRIFSSEIAYNPNIFLARLDTKKWCKTHLSILEQLYHDNMGHLKNVGSVKRQEKDYKKNHMPWELQ